jgi:putative membrane protein
MNTKILTLRTCAALAMAAAFFSTSLNAANSTDQGMAVKGSDKAFFEKAAKSGEKEVIVSQAVLPTLTNPEVRSFAQSMISDHTLANNELKNLAARKGVTLPVIDPKLAVKWSEKSKNVDADYLDEMVSDHKEAVDLFEKAAKSEDADVAAFASSTLPKLQHHLDMAKSLEKSVK